MRPSNTIWQGGKATRRRPLGAPNPVTCQRAREAKRRSSSSHVRQKHEAIRNMVALRAQGKALRTIADTVWAKGHKISHEGVWRAS